MEPVTHGLTLLALGRARMNKVTRLATPMLLLAGYAPDADWLSYFGGPAAVFAFRRTMLHSLAGTAALATVVAAAFWWIGRRHPKAPVRLWRALLVCYIAAGSHLLLDLPNPYGLQLLWPFRDKWFAWGIVETVDIWVFAILLLGLLLPALFRLVSEEIGAHVQPRGARRGAIVALALIVVYGGSRWVFRIRAEEILRSRMYHGAAPLVVAAYPSSVSPVTWRGMVETENTIEEVEVHLGRGGYFDPDRGMTNYKPEPSVMLEAARQTVTVQNFVRFARFPLARVQRLRNGYQVELVDLRFASDTPRPSGFMVRVGLDEEMRVVKEEIRPVPPRRPGAAGR